MSTGRSEARRAAQTAQLAASADRQQRLLLEQKLQRERERNQQLFIRKLRARAVGGFFNRQDSNTSSTLG